MAETSAITENQEQILPQSVRGTLQLRWPFGRTLGLGLCFLVVFALLGEWVAETNAFRTFFTHQTWDSSHVAFERQLARLDLLYQQEGKIECIFLGNSMVWRGFDPQAFQAGYRSQTGADLPCFDFGVDGMPASNAGALAQVLVEDYHPRLLIYGVDARDYAVPADSKDAKVLAEMDWLKYRLGQFSLKGWLIEHSELYRYRFALQRLLRFDYQHTIRDGSYTNLLGRYGFDFDERAGDVATPPRRDDPRGPVQYYFGLLSGYQMLPENIYGLEQVLEQDDEVEELVVVELPVAATYMEFFGNGVADYQTYLERVKKMTLEEDGYFVESMSWGVIPADGWVDYSHLNRVGAAAFSRALGEKIGAAKLAGQLGRFSSR